MIEDDVYIAEACQEALKNEFEIEVASTLDKARSLLRKINCQLILLDIQLPDGNGLDFISEIRHTSSIPIIFISVYDQDDIISRGLDLGADDYMIKPFSLKVLKSRIQSVLRRYYKNNTKILSFDELEIDLERQIVKKDKHNISLSPIESELFFLLVKARGKVLTRRYLLETIWDQKGDYVEDNTLTVTIKRLKDKLGSEYIKTKRHVGYFFEGGNQNE